MLKIENVEFREKFTEINIRQRMYEGNSFITMVINTEFYPSLVKENIVSGVIEVKLDIDGIKSLDDLVNKSYDGDIGKVTISVNNNGIWEHNTKDKFKVEIKSRNGRELEFLLETDNCTLETTGILVSLYTTSTGNEELKKNFDLSDFYENSVDKEIGSSKIIKYFVKA